VNETAVLGTTTLGSLVDIATIASAAVLVLIFWVEFSANRRAKKTELQGRRIRHYESIHDVILDLLALRVSNHGNNNISWIQLSLIYNIAGIRNNTLPNGTVIPSASFRDAETHLGKDLPKFLATLTATDRAVSAFNDESDKLRISLHEEAFEKLSKITTLSADRSLRQSIYLPEIIQHIESQWFGIIVQTSNKSLADALMEVPNWANVVDYPDNRILLDNRVVGRITSKEKIEELKSTLQTIVKNQDALQRMLDFRTKRDKLEYRLNQDLTSHMKEVWDTLYLMEKERYKTVCDCCPK
jgi:hypothetical protein